jgi:nucleoside-diphosphate-sugar epimerase
VKNQRVLITGGAGLVGSPIAEFVAAQRCRASDIFYDVTRGRRANVRAIGTPYPPRGWANISRATERLGFTAELDLREALQHPVQWWRQNWYGALARVASR